MVPDELGHGVLRWGGDYLPFHRLFHVRDEVVLQWNVKLPAAGGRGRAPLALDFQEAVTRWMASITADELALVSQQRPMRFVPRPVWAPFDGFTIVHPSYVDHHEPLDEERLLSPITYNVFPSFSSEVPDVEDVAWHEAQLVDIPWADLNRSPASAVRFAKARRGAKTFPVRKVLRPRDATLSGYTSYRDVYEFENWRSHLLRLEGNRMTLSTGEATSVAGQQHGLRILRAFLDRDELLEDAGGPDMLTSVSGQVVASGRDVENGIEPIDLEERFTGTVLAELRTRLVGRTLHIEYELKDDRLTEEGLREAISIAYLQDLTADYYRDKADELRIWKRGDERTAQVMAYPTRHRR